MATNPREFRFTVSDLELFPEDGNRYEVIDGELYVSHAPDLRHQLTSGRLDKAFTNWCDATPGRGMPVAAAGVVFAFDTGVIPDFMWVSSARVASIVIDPATGEPGGRFYQAPDLLVEIVSPGAANQQRDREVKLKLYGQRGAREYWIVDYLRRTIEIHRRTPAATLELGATLGEGDILTSPLLPDFALSVTDVFTLPPELAALLGKA